VFFQYEHLLAGISGGVVSTLLLHPLDLLKIRFAGLRVLPFMIPYKRSRTINDFYFIRVLMVPDTGFTLLIRYRTQFPCNAYTVNLFVASGTYFFIKNRSIVK